MWHGATLGMLTPKEACLSSIGENPPAEKIERSDKSNRANSAERFPNPTRKFKTLAPSLSPLVCYLPALGDPRNCTFGTLAPKASSSQAASLARRHLVAVGYLPRGEYDSHASGLCLAIQVELRTYSFFTFQPYKFNS